MNQTDKKVELLIEQKHPKGGLPKGAIYTYDDSMKMYVYRVNGKIWGTVNATAVNAFPWMFKWVDDE